AGLVAAVAQGLIAADERVVVLSTGNGLKDIAAARRSAGDPLRVAATLEAIEGLEELGGGWRS
ncbi:MAG: threonine synthase, partial [Anaerolineae bacterium]|nr:threonine synthase [Anaerolineae bacterium]